MQFEVGGIIPLVIQIIIALQIIPLDPAIMVVITIVQVEATTHLVTHLSIYGAIPPQPVTTYLLVIQVVRIMCS